MLKSLYVVVCSGLLVAGCQTTQNKPAQELSNAEQCSIKVGNAEKRGSTAELGFYISTKSISAVASAVKFVAEQTSNPRTKDVLGAWTLIDVNTRKSCSLAMNTDPKNKSKQTVRATSDCALGEDKAVTWELQGKELVLKGRSGDEAVRLVNVNKTCWKSASATSQTEYVLRR